MTEPTNIAERLRARAFAAEQRASAEHWLQRWGELPAESLEAAWRGDLLEALAAGADEAAVDQLVGHLSRVLRISRRAIRNTVRAAGAAGALPADNTTDAWARRWIAAQDQLGGFRAGPGCAYYTRDDDPVWRTMTVDDASVSIGSMPAGPGCKTRQDYRSIARHALLLLERDEARPPASQQPLGVAVGDECLRLQEGRVTREPLLESHYVRLRLQAELRPLSAAPLYTHYLSTLAPDGSPHAEEIRRAFGLAAFAVMFNLGERMQQTILLYGAAGAGKSTGQHILSSMVPRELRCAVPPDRWGNEYQLARMSRAVLNVVEDLDYRKPLGAEFKRVVGNNTLVSARDPYGSVFEFEPRLTHVFSTNELPATRIHDDGFWRRWVIVPFHHRVAPEDRREGLGEQIVREELGAVIQHALDVGAIMFNAEGKMVHSTPLHQLEIMDQWEEESNIVLQFLTDESFVTLDEERNVNRMALYELFAEWSRANGYAQMGNRTFLREFRRLAPRYGIALVKSGDQRFWRGLGAARF